MGRAWAEEGRGWIFRGGKELRFVDLANQVASGFVAGSS